MTDFVVQFNAEVTEQEIDEALSDFGFHTVFVFKFAKNLRQVRHWSESDAVLSSPMPGLKTIERGVLERIGPR